MDEERIERQMAFIIDHQAKFLSDVDRLRERQDLQEKNLQRQANNIDRLAAEMGEGFGRLTDALLSLTHIGERHDSQIAALAELGKETDVRLNALINVVERHVSNHENGRQN